MQFFFQTPSNSFNLQHLTFAFALDAGEYVEQCNKQDCPRLQPEQNWWSCPTTVLYCETKHSDQAKKKNQKSIKMLPIQGGPQCSVDLVENKGNLLTGHDMDAKTCQMSIF